VIAPVLNRLHSLAQGLVFYVCDGHAVDLVSGAPGSFPGSSRKVSSTKWGRAFESDDGNSRVTFRDAHIIARIGTQHTMFIAYDTSVLDGDTGIISVPYNTGGPFPPLPYHSMMFGNDGTDAFTRYTVGGTQNFWIPSVGFATGSHTYAWTRNGSAQKFYRDGPLQDSTSAGSTSPPDFTGTYQEVTLMAYAGVLPMNGPNGKVAVAAIWNRALSAADVAMVSADPKVVLDRSW
jgi:hypothetical protein